MSVYSRAESSCRNTTMRMAKTEQGDTSFLAGEDTGLFQLTWSRRLDIPILSSNEQQPFRRKATFACRLVRIYSLDMGA